MAVRPRGGSDDGTLAGIRVLDLSIARPRSVRVRDACHQGADDEVERHGDIGRLDRRAGGRQRPSALHQTTAASAASRSPSTSRRAAAFAVASPPRATSWCRTGGRASPSGSASATTTCAAMTVRVDLRVRRWAYASRRCTTP